MAERPGVAVVTGGADDVDEVVRLAEAAGARVAAPSVDLAEVDAAERILAEADGLGTPAGLVLCHSESVDSSILDTTSATELGARGLRADALNPGPIDTGWMSDGIRADALAATPAGRLGTPDDIADLVAFLLGPRGGRVTGQRLFSNGGFRTAD